MPSPPEELSDDGRQEWDRISRELYGAGLLTSLDRGALTAYCDAYGRWAQASRTLAEMARVDPVSGGMLVKTKDGNVIQNPVVGIMNRARADMVKFAAEFGMTPSARSRITANPPDDKEDPATKYFG